MKQQLKEATADEAVFDKLISDIEAIQIKIKEIQDKIGKPKKKSPFHFQHQIKCLEEDRTQEEVQARIEARNGT